MARRKTRVSRRGKRSRTQRREKRSKTQRRGKRSRTQRREKRSKTQRRGKRSRVSKKNISRKNLRKKNLMGGGLNWRQLRKKSGKEITRADAIELGRTRKSHGYQRGEHINAEKIFELLEPNRIKMTYGDFNQLLRKIETFMEMKTERGWAGGPDGGQQTGWTYGNFLTAGEDAIGEFVAQNRVAEVVDEEQSPEKDHWKRIRDEVLDDAVRSLRDLDEETKKEMHDRAEHAIQNWTETAYEGDPDEKRNRDHMENYLQEKWDDLPDEVVFHILITTLEGGDELFQDVDTYNKVIDYLYQELH